MSCSERGMRPHPWGDTKWGEPTCRIHIEFDRGEPWDYQLALNGRRIVSMAVGGKRVVFAPEKGFDDCEVD